MAGEPTIDFSGLQVPAQVPSPGILTRESSLVRSVEHEDPDSYLFSGFLAATAVANGLGDLSELFEREDASCGERAGATGTGECSGTSWRVGAYVTGDAIPAYVTGDAIPAESLRIPCATGESDVLLTDFSPGGSPSQSAGETGGMPRPEQVAEYIEKHGLQSFLKEVVMYVARHLPPDPFDFLLTHMPDMVSKHRSSGGKWALEAEPLTGPLEPTAQPMTAELQERVIKHVTSLLKYPDVIRASAQKLFRQFAASDKMQEKEFGGLLSHLESAWGIRPEDSKLLVETLKRWRFRANVNSGTHGLPLWPMTLDDLTSSFSSLLRALRDRYAPIGGMVHRSLFLRQSWGTLNERYDIGPRLGRGAYGEVVLVTMKANAERRVVKRVRKQQQRLPSEDLVQEVDLLRSLDHPHIIRLFEYFETDEHIEMIMEPVYGGTLTQVIRGLYFGQGGHISARPAALTETWVATVSSQLLSALRYAHDIVGVIHKDLKADNVLMVGQPNLPAEDVLRQPTHAMLADFGIAEVFAPDPALDVDGRKSVTEMRAPHLQGSRVGGTREYMSPEMFRGTFSEKCDIWSLGVMVFQVMTGELPYRSNNLLTQVNLVCNPRRHPQWDVLTTYRWTLGARLFCQSLLAKDESMRPSAAEASRDDWLAHAQDVQPPAAPSESEKASLQQQHLQSHLMHMARHCITSQLCLSPLHHLNVRFQQCDVTKDGRLSHVEMQQVLEDVGITNKEDMELIIESMDTNRNGFIEYSEFMAGCLNLAGEDMRQQLRMVFDIFDLDGSGSIGLEELRQVLTQGAAPLPRSKSGVLEPTSAQSSSLLPDGKTVEEVMAEMDQNKDGAVDYEEFERYLLAEHADSARRSLARSDSQR